MYHQIYIYGQTARHKLIEISVHLTMKIFASLIFIILYFVAKAIVIPKTISYSSDGQCRSRSIMANQMEWKVSLQS